MSDIIVKTLEEIKRDKAGRRCCSRILKYKIVLSTKRLREKRIKSCLTISVHQFQRKSHLTTTKTEEHHIGCLPK